MASPISIPPTAASAALSWRGECEPRSRASVATLERVCPGYRGLLVNLLDVLQLPLARLS
ncbi:MAG: hypothetical protein LKI25_08000 [Atopobiaceae bacterium]|jgi:hypothetical protein|nr:hypothetical protein [Atopobiaceae bacterium]MCI2174128.1 hypothetical protein [Atopobiaceae bacterium]MCI2206769.1 hypothetical protein [Atopobiaceae bacterium]